MPSLLPQSHDGWPEFPLQLKVIGEPLPPPEANVDAFAGTNELGNKLALMIPLDKLLAFCVSACVARRALSGNKLIQEVLVESRPFMNPLVVSAHHE